MSQKITILAPANELPAEGADPKPLPEGQEPGASDLLDSYASLFEEAALTFEISPDGEVSLGETAPEEELVFLNVSSNGDSEPAFSLDEASSPKLDLAGAAESVTGTFDAEDGLKKLVENLSNRLKSELPDGKGAPVPLVRWHKTDEGAEDGEESGVAELLGIWLADEAQLEALRAGSGEQRILFEDADVEGRGLREGLAALAVVGVMIGGATSAEAGFLFFKSKAEKQAEQRAKMVQAVHPHQARASIDANAVQKARELGVQVIVDVSKQRAYVVAADGDILIDTPVSTARTGKYTPRGEFKITQKVRSGKTSTIYGCALPCWMRLGSSPIGLHVGDLPGYPASAGCIRLPSYVAPVIFDAAQSGTTVKVVNSWQPQPKLYAAR